MKKTLSFVLAALLILSLAACGGKAPAETTQPVATTLAPEEAQQPTETMLGTQDVTITFWHSASDEAGVLMDKYVREFNETNEYGITVKAVYQGQYSDATTLLRTVISAENYGELPDIMQMDATGKITYFGSGKAYTVDDVLKDYPGDGFLDHYLTGALGNWQFAGHQLGLPFATSTTVTYCNMDLLKQAGWDKAPDTFDDVIALYQDMCAAGMTEKVLQAVPNTPTLANWLGQLGSYVVDQSNGADGTATELACLDNGALVTFLTAWKEMYDSGAILNENSSTDKFVAGEVVLMTTSSANVTNVLNKVGGNFEVGVSSYLRVNDTASYGATVSGSCLVLFDSEDALRKEAAWQFMQYLTSAEVQADFAAGTGYIPAHVDAMNTASYQAVTAEYPQYTVAFLQLSNTPAAMRSVTVGPSTDFYYGIIQAVSDMLEYNQTPEETAQIMADELTLLLEDYARNNA